MRRWVAVVTKPRESNRVPRRFQHGGNLTCHFFIREPTPREGASRQSLKIVIAHRWPSQIPGGGKQCFIFEYGSAEITKIVGSVE